VINKPFVVILDEQLISIQGHHYEYIRSVKETFERKGYHVVVYGNAQVIPEIVESIGAIPHFDFNAKAWYRSIPLAGPILYRLQFWQKLYGQFKHTLQKHALDGTQVCFFVPNIYWYNAYPIFKAFADTDRRSWFLIRSSVVHLFDVPKHFRKAVHLLYKQVSRRVSKNGHLRLVTDSIVIEQEWRTKYGNDIITLPIPHLSTANVETPQTIGTRMRLYAPGVMRMEKGMALIMQSLQAIEDENILLAQHLHFVVQIFGEREKIYFDGYKKQLQSFKHITVEILGSLSSEAYHQEVAKADIICIPYVAAQGYQARTSGVLCEAIAACKPVITSKNTWMEAVCLQYNTGVVAAENVDSFCEALSEMVRQYDVYALKAVNAAPHFMEFHTKDNFYQLLQPS
jgi:glycosyltransferase involved in cell wall biosynthesis